MAAKSKPTWIAVMDGGQARFFVLRRTEDGQVFEEIATPLGPKSTGHRPQLFAREVAGLLDGARAGRRYEHLVLVAPPRNLAELREHLSARVRETLAHQVPKNLAKLGTDALWEKLSAILLKAARPVNDSGTRVPTVSGNSLPVAVVFRNMEASATVQSAALRYAAKLGRKYGRIQMCRVIVDAPKHAHRKVKEFRVAVDLKLPGHEIATKTTSSDGAAYDDINTALREAFGVAARQLQDHMRRIKDNVLHERRHASPRARGFAEA
jgi:ribosome-associated translation inhibitor RaiA